MTLPITKTIHQYNNLVNELLPRRLKYDAPVENIPSFVIFYSLFLLFYLVYILFIIIPLYYIGAFLLSTPNNYLITYGLSLAIFKSIGFVIGLSISL